MLSRFSEILSESHRHVLEENTTNVIQSVRQEMGNQDILTGSSRRNPVRVILAACWPTSQEQISLGSDCAIVKNGNKNRNFILRTELCFHFL